MYNVTLVNLTSDARAVTPEADRIEFRDVPAAQMEELLRNLSDIDPTTTLAVEPEVRVQVRGESYVIRAGQKKLVLYDVLNREAPGETMAVERVMAELDGSALAARTAAPWTVRAAEMPSEDLALERSADALAAALRRRTILLAIFVVLLAALILLRLERREAPPADFLRSPAAKAATTLAALAGVYLTGTEPGQHGIVLSENGDVRLFEWRAVEAPSAVYGRVTPGQVGATPALLTDQPGGLITAPEPDVLVYCGETYNRVP